MTRKSKPPTKYRAPGARRVRWLMLGVILLAVVMVADYLSWGKPSAAPGPNTSKLIGSWLRPDGGYVLELSHPAPDGLLKAAYFNPRPINVSRAQWRQHDGVLNVFVELRDAGYPGSIYMLAYHPAEDQLVGTYFQAALRQLFSVAFKRTR
jgi:hypothetical protein